MVEAVIEPTFESWRQTARRLLARNTAPEAVLWTHQQQGGLLNFADETLEAPALQSTSPATVPRAFMGLAETVACHRDPQRWALLYRVLFRLTHGEPRLLEVAVDDDVHVLGKMDKAVRRDVHKMHAFVRFRKVEGPEAGQEQYIAFHRPDHLIVRRTAPWFAKRFAVLNWTILTPDASATWDGETITYAPGVPASKAPAGDEVEDLWLAYYASIFNPARVKVKAMKKEMPVRHWKTLPEAVLIESLLREAPARVGVMRAAHAPAVTETYPATKQHGAAAFVPKVLELKVLQEAAATCKGCDLYCNATQTVFGTGPARARLMLVGEQPGDNEDLAGLPFVGPAGQLLDQALAEAGIDRGACYVTNAVKHFKFEQQGERRIHAKPSSREVSACRPWLEAEIATVQPAMIVALGATAAQALVGPQFRVTHDRGKPLVDTRWAPWLMGTIHPSALLRIPDPALRKAGHEAFVRDLRVAARALAEAGA